MLHWNVNPLGASSTTGIPPAATHLYVAMVHGAVWASRKRMERPADWAVGRTSMPGVLPGLARAIVAAVSTPLQVLDAAGAVVADGVLSGETSTVTVRLGIGG
jgi:hypothetical protein